MAKRKCFSDDGWALWVTGDDTSTLYLNEWLNPKGKSFVDVGIRIRGVKATHSLHLYIPFTVEAREMEDISFHLKDENIFRAIFSTRCILDYMKNRCTSELAYHGRTLDLVHISTTEYTINPLASGTMITVSVDALKEYLDNDEAYLLFRLPHKNLNEIFKPRMDMQNAFVRLRDLVTSPVISEKYSCSVRINEARLLPEEINQIGSFHRQKLNKAVITISIDEDYQVNDSNCYRIHRTEEELYGCYAPEGFSCENAVTYEWIESRERNLYGHFNFYFGIFRESISRTSMMIYVTILFVVGLLGNFFWGLLAPLLGM